MSPLVNVALSELMASKVGSVDPAKFSDEVFDLYSIPAFDRGAPEVALGASIGSSKQLVRPGDILLSKIVPHIRRSWVVGEDRGRRLIASGEWIVFRSERVDQAYLRHVLVGDSFHSQFMQTVSGVGGSLLRARPIHVAKIEVPLPALPEQRRIAAILDQADSLRTKRREALVQLDSVARALFIEMFGDMSVSPKFQLGSIRPYVDAKSGKSPKSVLSEVNTGIPIYGGNGVNGWATTSLYEHSVIIFGRVGQQCGNSFISEGPSWVTDNAIVVNVSDNTKLNPIFVLHAFQRSSFSNRVKHLDLPFINQSMILDNPIPIPPLSVQQIFANRINAVEKLKLSHLASLSNLDMLFASLQYRAFRGEL